jgi:MSHA biogenesis protein MshG
MMGSGVSIAESLKAQEEQARDVRLQDVIFQLRCRVEEGIPLYVAMEDHPNVFDETSVRIVEAGEQSGQLPKALSRLARMMEFDLQIRKRLAEATRYPKFVILTLIVAVGLLVSFVIPKFADLFKNSNVQLPIFTKIILNFYSVVGHYWPIFLFLALLFVIFFGILKKNPSVALTLDRWKVRLPLVGGIRLKIELSRVFRILSWRFCWIAASISSTP